MFEEKRPTLAPLEKRSLADNVVASLREAIVSGRFAPSERLQETALAEFLGVSRGPIREALRQLEREGMVIKYPNRGTFVARLSPGDAEEVYSLRLALEKLAMRWAIRNALPEHLAGMQACVDSMAQMAERQTTEQEAAQVDIEFHDALYKSTGHSRLYEAWWNLRTQVHILLLSRNLVYTDYLRESAVSYHQAIVDVIRAKDEEQAVLVIEHHITEAYERVMASYGAREPVFGTEHALSADLSRVR
jgi:DNA-binding GntR family transcriptional regulator